MKNIILLILLSSLAFSQKRFQVDADFARFNFDKSTGYLEIYYAFHQSELTPVRIGDKTFVKGIIGLVLKDIDSGKTVVDRKWQINSDLLSQDSTDKDLDGVISFQLNFGRYICLLNAVDAYDSLKTDTLSFRVDISPLPSGRIAISDIELAGSIKKTDKKADSYFIKNGYEIIPNPGHIYGENLPVIYLYSEFYNLNYSGTAGPLKIEYRLQNPYGRDILTRSKIINVESNSIADVGAINVNRYPSGIYQITIFLIDSVKNLKVSTSRRFYIVNPSVIDTVPISRTDNRYLSSEFGAMSDEELDRVFEYSRYIATARETEEWQKLSTGQGKIQFLINFWKARRAPADLSKTITWDEYQKRIEIANQRYSAHQKQGWRTDRGRVLVLYGEPDEIERFPQQSDTKAYEIWHYNNIEGGVIFIFADLQGSGAYTLINSTKRGELKNDNWQRQISTF